MPQAKRTTPQNHSARSATTEIQSLKDKIKRLDTEVRALKDILNIRDNWHSEIKEWVGKLVVINSGCDSVSSGLLIWVDRYHICVESKGIKTIHPKGVVSVSREVE